MFNTFTLLLCILMVSSYVPQCVILNVHSVSYNSRTLCLKFNDPASACTNRHMHINAHFEEMVVSTNNLQ